MTDLADDCWKIDARVLNDTPMAELDALAALVRNHPSSVAEPSRADKDRTQTLKAMSIYR